MSLSDKDKRLIASTIQPAVERATRLLVPSARPSFRQTLGRPVLSEPASTAVSPTGKAVIPPAAVPYVLAGSAVLTLLAEELTNPTPWTIGRGIGLLVKVVGMLALGASPGLRR